MKRELDFLLNELRHSAVPASLLDDVERRVWQQIAVREVLAQSPQLRLSFQVISVAAAFLLGILLGVDVAQPAPTQSFLVEEVNLLPPGPGGLLL